MIEPKFLQMWAALRGRGYLWHRTSFLSLQKILDDQQIKPNSGQRSPTFGQSRVSYAWHLGAVSLFDFDTCSEPDIFDQEWKWGTVLTKRVPAGVLIAMKRGSLDPEKLILPPQIQADDARLNQLPTKIRSGRMIIPFVEALHVGPIPASTFDRYILSARSDNGDYLMYETEHHTDFLEELRERSVVWDTANAIPNIESRSFGESS